MLLPAALENLVQEAERALKKVHVEPKDSVRDTTVGSAILATSGQMYTGVNITHFTGGPCAEHSAIGNALATGARGDDFTHVVAVVNDERRVLSPCGKCRQILFDYYPHIKVIVPSGKSPGDLIVVDVTDLLPYAYVWKPKNRVQKKEIVIEHQEGKG